MSAERRPVNNHGERGEETWQLPRSAMDSAVWILDILTVYREKSVMMDSLLECHEEFVNLSSGHCESVRTRSVLISCLSDHARCMAQVQV